MKKANTIEIKTLEGDTYHFECNKIYYHNEHRFCGCRFEKIIIKDIKNVVTISNGISNIISLDSFLKDHQTADSLADLYHDNHQPKVNMTLIDEIKADKEKLASDITELIQKFEDKHGCVEVGDIHTYKVSLSGPYYGKVAVSFACNINGIS